VDILKHKNAARSSCSFLCDLDNDIKKNPLLLAGIEGVEAVVQPCCLQGIDFGRRQSRRRRETFVAMRRFEKKHQIQFLLKFQKVFHFLLFVLRRIFFFLLRLPLRASRLSRENFIPDVPELWNLWHAGPATSIFECGFEAG
jgi:hypothetical protein